MRASSSAIIATHASTSRRPPQAAQRRIAPDARQCERQNQQYSHCRQVGVLVGRNYVCKPDHAQCWENRHTEPQPAGEQRPRPAPRHQQQRDQYDRAHHAGQQRRMRKVKRIGYRIVRRQRSRPDHLGQIEHHIVADRQRNPRAGLQVRQFQIGRLSLRDYSYDRRRAAIARSGIFPAGPRLPIRRSGQ